MPKVTSLYSRKILDSRSKWTIETTLILDNSTGISSVPGGTSIGKFEAKSLIFNEALEKIESIKDGIIGKTFNNQKEFDDFLIKLDGTSDKSNLGANTLLSLSISYARALSKLENIPLYKYISKCIGFNASYEMPKIMMLMFEGGKHGAKNINIQEFMVVVSSVDLGNDIYDLVKDTIIKKGCSVEVGLEGAFSPPELSDYDVLDILKGVSKYPIALDIAASSSSKLVDSVRIINRYPVLSVEDPFGEEEWTKWKDFNRDFGGKVLIVGDDLIATNPKRIDTAIKMGACSAVIIKPNQIGTVSETLEAIRVAREGALKIVVSHRSGETNDSFIADLAVGVGANYVKFGAPSRGERVAKYNRLLEIFS